MSARFETLERVLYFCTGTLDFLWSLLYRDRGHETRVKTLAEQAPPRLRSDYRGLRTTSITFSDAIGTPSFVAGW